MVILPPYLEISAVILYVLLYALAELQDPAPLRLHRRSVGLTGKNIATVAVWTVRHTTYFSSIKDSSVYIDDENSLTE